MPMTPIAVDKGAIYKQQAASQVAGLKGFGAAADKGWADFKAEENKKWEEFTKQAESDTQSYYTNMNNLAGAMKANGVTTEQLQAGLFELGFSNAMQGIPASHIRAAVSGMASQLLAPENKEALAGFSDQVKHVFDVPTKEQVLEDVKSQIEQQAAQAGQEVPKEKMDELVKKYEPRAEEAVKQQAAQVDSLKQQASATDAALTDAKVPEEEKAGDMTLVGFQAGAETRKAMEQQQAQFMEMLQKLQGGGAAAN